MANTSFFENKNSNAINPQDFNALVDTLDKRNAEALANLAASKASNDAATANLAQATTAATEKANLASTSATNASNSEKAALASQNAAKTSETNSKTSETNAGTSATNAASSASGASTSATNASNSATAASTSATNAGASDTNALASKNAAATSATNAATSETNALASKNAAATSATNAATSETNALASKNAAATSATNASTSETNALASKNAAATSATNASTSETNALASKNSAATSLVDFKNRYQGALAAAPTARPDGTALQAGDEYFDTALGHMRVWLASGSFASASTANTYEQSVIDSKFSVANARADAAPFRNKLINAAMQIDQRNSGAIIANAQGNTFGPDRWLLGCGDASFFNMGREAGGPGANTGAQYCFVAASRASRLLTATQYAYIAQRIEGLSAADSLWGTASARNVMLSFWVHSSLAGTHSGAINNFDSSRSYPFTFSLSANTWTKVSVSIPGDTAGVWKTDTSTGIQVCFSLGSGTTYQGPAGAWAAANYTGTTGAVQHIENLDATLRVALVQFEYGTTATAFESRPIGLELSMCQRYYRAVTCTHRFPASALNQYGNSTVSWTPMRLTPTATQIGIESTNLTTSWALVIPNNAGGRFEVISNAAGDVYAVHVVYALNAEL